MTASASRAGRQARGLAARSGGPAPVPRDTRSVLGLDGRSDPIEHVIVLMLENRSFDHMLGRLRSKFPTLNGIDPNAPGHNVDHTDNNRRYDQAPTTTTALERDPKHELANVRTQLNTGGPCGGFITDFRTAYHTDIPDTQEVMGTTTTARCRCCTRWRARSPSATGGSRQCPVRPGPTGCSCTAAPRSAVWRCPTRRSTSICTTTTRTRSTTG